MAIIKPGKFNGCTTKNRWMEIRKSSGIFFFASEIWIEERSFHIDLEPVYSL
jgi:hypothetical protein